MNKIIYPLMLKPEFLALPDHIVVLDGAYRDEYPDILWVAVYDHSRCWGDVEIYEFTYAPTDAVRHMWE